jgi:hypothetical protein
MTEQMNQTQNCAERGHRIFLGMASHEGCRRPCRNHATRGQHLQIKCALGRNQSVTENDYPMACHRVWSFSMKMQLAADLAAVIWYQC